MLNKNPENPKNPKNLILSTNYKSRSHTRIINLLNLKNLKFIPIMYTPTLNLPSQPST